VVLIVAACTTPTQQIQEVKVEVTREVVVEVKSNGGIPYEALWKGSAHNAVDTEPFRHWDGDDPAEVPTACARCHTTAGYRDYLGTDGSEALKVDKAVPAAESQGIQCVACHNPVTTFQLTVEDDAARSQVRLGASCTRTTIGAGFTPAPIFFCGGRSYYA